MQISGEYWHHQQRGWRDVIRCLLWRHSGAMTWAEEDGTRGERCTCGAIRLDGRFWLGPVSPFRRVSQDESVRLTAADHERKQQMEESHTRLQRSLAALRAATPQDRAAVPPEA